MGRLRSFYFAVFFIYFCGFNSAFAVPPTPTSFRYEGRLQGPGITGIIPNQTFSVSLRRPDGCGGNLGLSAWSSSTVTLDNGAFSISPSFDPDLLAKAMNPWNDFSATCTVDFRRQMVITWSGENFVVDIEDSPRATLASYAVNAANSSKIGNTNVQTNLACSNGYILKFVAATTQFECQPLAAGDIPALGVSQVPALAGDVSGAVNLTSVDKIKGVPVSAVAPSNNQVLKFSAGVWAPAADDTGGAVVDASYALKGVVQINTDQATSGLFISGGVLALPNLIATAPPLGNAQTIPVITWDQKGRITATSSATVDDITKLPLGGGTMAGTINMGDNILHSVGNLGVGTATPSQLIEVNGNDEPTLVSVVNKSSTAFRQTGYSATNYSGAINTPAQYIGKSSRGSSVTPLSSLNNDQIFSMVGAAGDGTGGFRTVSMISLYAEENISTTSSAGGIRFATTPVGTTSPVERMRISPFGKVGIGTLTPNASLDVDGGIKFSDDAAPCIASKIGTLRYNTGNMQICDGTAWKIVNGSSSGVSTIAQGGTNNNFFNLDQMVFYSSVNGRIESFACGIGQTLAFSAAGVIACETPNMANTLARFDGAGKLVTPGGIDLPNNVTLKLPSFSTADPGGLAAPDQSRVWYNQTMQEIRYWDGTMARRLPTQDGNTSFTGNNTFSGANTFTGATNFTSSLSTNSLNTSSVTSSGVITSGSSITGSSLIASGTLKVGSGNNITNITTCQNAGTVGSGVLGTTISSCAGVNTASTCSCQWHGMIPTSAISYITPGSGSVLITFASSTSGTATAGSIRCVCYN